ncbi:uncharacterized protein CDAR_261871 [Caerostris darwini]|uniref:DUF19 domain-containing protein n=1 Tax=Caerostris darwini TaxID=1538125 RepID=A0AAV4V1W9_9ARAC|nr:uncharacterized protein CDAR_261871 [Caerostris darwini]
MFLFIISAFIVAGVSTTEGTTCNNFDLVVCAFLVDGDRTAKSGFAETEDSLDKRCDQTLPVLKCLSDYGAKCPETSFKHLADFFGDEYKTQTKICTKNDELRQRYLTYSKCLNMHRKSTEDKCGKLLEFEEANQFTVEHCKNYEENFQCSLKEIQKSCGKDAMLLLTDVLTPVHNFMEVACKDFQDLHDFAMLKSVLSR